MSLFRTTLPVGRVTLVVLAASVLGPSPRAADTLTYAVELAPTGDAALDTALRDSSTLISLREAPVGGFALIARARNDIARLTTVLNSFGHYRARVDVTVDGRTLDDLALPARLDELPAAQTVKLAVGPVPGPVFRVRRVSLRGDVPAGAADGLGLAEGAPAIASDVLAAGTRLQARLQADGYALARVAPPVATLDDAATALDVAYPVRTGPRVDIGEIRVEGLERLDEGYAVRRLGLTPGERYSPERLAAARQNLADSPAIASVRVDPGETLDADGRIPVIVRATERKLHAVSFGAQFSTDQGGSLSAAWTHRNLFGNAEQLTVSGAITQLGGSATTGIGYNLGTTFTVPDWYHADQTLTVSATALREFLRAYDRTGYIAGVAVARRISPRLTVSLGVTGIQEQIRQEGVTRDYTLLQTPLTAAWDTTGSLLDAVSGYRLGATLTPTVSLGGRQTQFLVAQANAAGFFDVGSTPGRSIVAVRALVGTTQGAALFDLPPDQRFYAGGSATVRGYSFQSIGPRFASFKPTGGTAIAAGTVELRQRIGEAWGAAAFVDAGQVTAGSARSEGGVRIGAGVGARYYTAIGPVRLDVAVPVNRTGKTDAFEVYIGLGQAF